MSPRHVLYTALSTNPGVVATYGNRIIDAGALGGQAGTLPTFPFLVVKHAEGTAAPHRRVFDRAVELWSYDNPGDYTRTEKGLSAVATALETSSGLRVEVGGIPWWLIEARFQGMSRDLTDDMARASVKYSTFRLIGNTNT